MDIATWLRELGLERYEAAFGDNDVDADILTKVTAEDLLAIGVTSVGHRRGLLDIPAASGPSWSRRSWRAPPSTPRSRPW